MSQFRSYFPFTCILKYIPSRYANLKGWQFYNRRAVIDFGKGVVSEDNKRKILKAVQNISKDNTSEYLLCFIPASTRKRHEQRYTELSQYLQKNLDFPVMLNAIEGYDRNPKYSRYKDPNIADSPYYSVFDFKIDSSLFRNKRVILIDDIITTGNTLARYGHVIKDSGAVSVYGVIFAMTIHPKLPKKKSMIRAV